MPHRRHRSRSRSLTRKHRERDVYDYERHHGYFGHHGHFGYHGHHSYHQPFAPFDYSHQMHYLPPYGHAFAYSPPQIQYQYMMPQHLQSISQPQLYQGQLFMQKPQYQQSPYPVNQQPQTHTQFYQTGSTTQQLPVQTMQQQPYPPMRLPPSPSPTNQQYPTVRAYEK